MSGCEIRSCDKGWVCLLGVVSTITLASDPRLPASCNFHTRNNRRQQEKKNKTCKSEAIKHQPSRTTYCKQVDVGIFTETSHPQLTLEENQIYTMCGSACVCVVTLSLHMFLELPHKRIQCSWEGLQHDKQVCKVLLPLLSYHGRHLRIEVALPEVLNQPCLTLTEELKIIIELW